MSLKWLPCSFMLHAHSLWLLYAIVFWVSWIVLLLRSIVASTEENGLFAVGASNRSRIYLLKLVKLIICTLFFCQLIIKASLLSFQSIKPLYFLFQPIKYYLRNKKWYYLIRRVGVSDDVNGNERKVDDYSSSEKDYSISWEKFSIMANCTQLTEIEWQRCIFLCNGEN